MKNECVSGFHALEDLESRKMFSERNTSRDTRRTFWDAMKHSGVGGNRERDREGRERREKK